MNTTIVAALKQLFIALAGISIVGATVATGTVGATNLVSKFTQKEQKIAQVQESEQQKTVAIEKIETIAKTSIRVSPSVAPVKKALTSSLSLTVTPSPASSVQTNSGCIVTLFGKQYDVTTLQQTHSGGNIFNCGTDMTVTYQGKHGTNMSRMQQYLVNTTGTSGTSGTSGSTGASGATNTSIKNDDRDDEEHENEERKQEMEKVLESAKKELEHEDD